MSTEAAAAIIFGVLQVSISVVALRQQHRLHQDRQKQRTSSTTNNPRAELMSGQGYGSRGKCIWIKEAAALLLLLLVMFLIQRALDLKSEATKTRRFDVESQTTLFVCDIRTISLASHRHTIFKWDCS